MELAPPVPDLTIARMLQGFHVILSTYGFWLPNDPRGSWSQVVRRWELLTFGPATKVESVKSVASKPHDIKARKAAKLALKYPEVKFTGKQALSVANGFRDAIEESNYLVYACTILPQHTHLVVGYHRRSIRRIVGHLKGRASQQLFADGLHPFREIHKGNSPLPSPWARNSWCVYIFDESHLRQAIRYVEENPLKEGKRRQRWSFVRRYGGGAGRATKK